MDHKLLDLNIQLANTNLPQKIDKGLLITQIFQQDNNVVYKLSVDEEDLGNDVEIIRQVKDQVKSDIAGSASNLKMTLFLLGLRSC